MRVIDSLSMANTCRPATSHSNGFLMGGASMERANDKTFNVSRRNNGAIFISKQQTYLATSNPKAPAP